MNKLSKRQRKRQATRLTRNIKERIKQRGLNPRLRQHSKARFDMEPSREAKAEKIKEYTEKIQ